jgi:transposase
MVEYVTIPLDIEGVKIDRVDVNNAGEIHIYVSSTEAGTQCHRCGGHLQEVYDEAREIKLRHLPILDHPSYIHIKPKRYICRSCPGHPTTTRRVSWYEPRSTVTKAYADYLLKQLVNSTLSDVSHKEDIGYGVLEDILSSQFGETVDWTQFKALPILGLDDLSVKKGHRDYVTLVTTRDEKGKNRLLGVLDGREKATVKAFLLSIPKELRKTIQSACCDLYEGYTEAVREVLGSEVEIVADRFHVAKLYRKGLDQVRKREMRRLQKELSEAEYGQLKGVMWLIRKPPESLDNDQRDTLRKLFNYSPILLMSYCFCWALTEIFNTPQSKTEAEERLRAWMRLVEERKVEGFETFLHTLDEKMDLITNYFIRRRNSGFVEGLNRKVRVLMGRCYGIFNRIHLFQRLSLDLGGYQQFA